MGSVAVSVGGIGSKSVIPPYGAPSCAAGEFRYPQPYSAASRLLSSASLAADGEPTSAV